ncbi:MAG: class I SAM-dependent methyltransferase [Candidatus Aquicultor sp.]|nr:class I SAM-dependent methyltransferase [Candidatus Aquicultor sp.]
MGGHKFHGDISRLDNPRRKEVFPVDAIVDALEGIDEGAAVADLGCGTGYLSIPLAKHLEGKGDVYAVDISEEMLKVLGERAEGAANLKLMKSEENSIPLPNGLIDTSFMLAVYHELDDPEKFLMEVRRFSKPVHKIVIVDWNQTEGEMGPPLNERVSEEDIITFFRNRGYGVMKRFSPSPYVFGVVFRVSTCRAPV